MWRKVASGRNSMKLRDTDRESLSLLSAAAELIRSGERDSAAALLHRAEDMLLDAGVTMTDDELWARLERLDWRGDDAH